MADFYLVPQDTVNVIKLQKKKKNFSSKQDFICLNTIWNFFCSGMLHTYDYTDCTPKAPIGFLAPITFEL